MRLFVEYILNLSRQNKLIPEECPFTYEEVVEQVIDDFNQMLEDYRTKEGHPLSEDKKSEYRDLRRRGKNRVRFTAYFTTF